MIYGLLATVMHGFRPLYLRGHWIVHWLVCGVFTSLAVLARPAVEHLRGGNLPLAEVMRNLSVRYFVQGSVRRTGE